MVNKTRDRTLPAILLFIFGLSGFMGCSQSASANTEKKKDPNASSESIFAAIPESRNGTTTNRINSDVALYFPATDDGSTVWSRNTPRAQILLRKDKDSDAKVVYEIVDDSKPWRIGPTRIDANVLVWIEYYQKEDTGPDIWRLCWKRIDQNKKVTIDQNDDKYLSQAPLFCTSNGKIAFSSEVKDANAKAKTTIVIYDISSMSVLKRIVADDADYYWPSMYENEVTFTRVYPDANTGELRSELMLYDLSDGTLTSLELGTRCFQPGIYGNTVVYNEALPGRTGTINMFDLTSKKKATIWPDARYVPDSWMKNPEQYGGFIPSVNEQYVTWNTRFPYVLCYDLHERKLIRFPSNASTILDIQAVPRNLLWFGDYGDGANRGHFVEIRRMN